MTRHMRRQTSLMVIAFALLMHAASTLHGQAPPAADVREQLEERYEVMTLQEGIALVPRRTDTGIRLIQIVNGVITIDGEPVSGGELRNRIGADADLVLQASYLDAADQPPAESPTPAGVAGVARIQVRSNDIVRFSGDVTIGRDERVDGDVVVMFGSADVDGEVTGDLVVVMGPLNLGPEAVVHGDVVVVGGRLNRTAGAQVLGDLNEVGMGRGVGNRDRRLGGAFGWLWSGVGGLAATVARIILMILAALIVLAVARAAVERIAARTTAAPARAGLTGFAAELLFVPLLAVTVVVLAVSIIGIPLILLVPFAVVLVMCGAFVGYTGLAYQVGCLLTRRFGWTDRGAYAAVAFGIVALAGLTLFAKLAGLLGGFLLGGPLVALGYFVEYAAWTVGFGAAILVGADWQRERRAGVSPVTPPSAESPPAEASDAERHDM